VIPGKKEYDMGIIRTKTFRRLLGFTLASFLLVPTVSAAADLEVTAAQIVPGPGSIRFILYRGPEGFRHEDKAF